MKEKIDLLEFLKHVQARPGMYLFKPDLTSLHIFITGYMVALGNQNISNKDVFLEEFNPWLQKKKGVWEGAGWYSIILDESNGSGHDGLLKFWVYLDEFRKEKESYN